jgi:hypothetical protein
MGRRIPGRLTKRAPRGPEGSSSDKRRSETALFWVQLVAGALAIAAILYGAGGTVAGWIGDAFGGGGGGRVEVVLAAVENQSERMTTAGGLFVQTRATTPRVDVTLRNTGDSAVLLTEARIVVEDSAWLPVCIFPGAGPVPVAGRYAVHLPFLPGAGERTVVKPLHDVVPAGGVDRFQLFFGATRLGEDDNLYALRVGVETEGGGNVDAGRFVLGVPTTVDRSGYILPEDDSALSNETFTSNRLASTWCYRYNLASVRRILSRPGKRTGDIAALEHIRLAPRWSAWADDRAPRDAVAPLFADPELNYGPLVAVFAAEQSGDHALLESTRRRAVTVLLNRAERALKPGPRFFPESAIEYAHASLSLSPSARGKELVARAEMLNREQEEELEEEAFG